jgi:hypothetical protein
LAGNPVHRSVFRVPCSMLHAPCSARHGRCVPSAPQQPSPPGYTDARSAFQAPVPSARLHPRFQGLEPPHFPERFRMGGGESFGQQSRQSYRGQQSSL